MNRQWKWTAAVLAVAGMAVWLAAGIAQAATVTYVGAEVSGSGSGWGTTTNTGKKCDFRTTDSSVKAWTLPGHANAYGSDGYVIWATGSTAQEPSGTYIGSLYSGTRSGSVFSNTTPYVSVSVAAGLSMERNAGFGNIDDPSGGIGLGPIADIAGGKLKHAQTNNVVQETFEMARLKFSAAASLVITGRVGVLVDSRQEEGPEAVILGGVSASMATNGGSYQPRWFFFDVTGIAPGDELALSVLEAGTNREMQVGGLVFDSVQPPNDAPVISGTAATPNPAIYTAALTATTTVSAVATDANGDPLSYLWTAMSGPGAVTFADANAATTLVNMAAVGTYVLRASVSDGKAAWVSSNLTVTVVAAAGVCYLTYVGAEVSSASSGGWGASWNSGYKKDFRSTDAGTKAWILPGHTNAYGAGGYIRFGQLGASVTQEPSGAYLGTIYTGTRSGASFNNPAPGIASVEILRGSVDTSNQGVAPLDDASLGIGTSVADGTNGTWWYNWPVGSTSDSVTNLFRITLNGNVRVPTIRVGILTDRGDGQRPGAIGLKGVWKTDLIGGNGQYNYPTWYFFDITNANAVAGNIVDISIKPWSSSSFSSNIRGLVFDAVELPLPSGTVFTSR